MGLDATHFFFSKVLADGKVEVRITKKMETKVSSLLLVGKCPINPPNVEYPSMLL